MIAHGRSLYARLVLRVGGVLAVSACALLFAIWISTQFAVNEAYDRLLTGSALQIAENTWYQNGAVNVDVPLAAFSMLTPGDQVFYAVVGPNGRKIAGDPEFNPAIPWNKLKNGPVVMDGTYQDLPVRIAIIGRRMPVAGTHPWAVIMLAQTKNSRLAFAKSLSTKTILVILVMGIFTAIAAMFTLYQALAPLKKIEEALKQRDPHDLSPLSLTVPTETHALVTSINAFMQRLAIHRALMRRVIGDAAHQLRTPVTALISQMELLSAESEESARARHLSRLRERTQNLGALVNQLINHAMVQNRANTDRPERIDLADLVLREMTDLLSNQERQLDLEMRAPDYPCFVLGDAINLREAVKNILINCLKYGAKTLIHVELTDQGEWLELRFADDGPGIPESEWIRVREPFSPRNGGRSGASLGLSIVEQVMRAHGGKLRFEHIKDVSFSVILEVKSADRPSA